MAVNLMAMIFAITKKVQLVIEMEHIKNHEVHLSLKFRLTLSIQLRMRNN